MSCRHGFLRKYFILTYINRVTILSQFLLIVKGPELSIGMSKWICEDCAHICPSIVDKINEIKKSTQNQDRTYIFFTVQPSFVSMALWMHKCKLMLANMSEEIQTLFLSEQGNIGPNYQARELYNFNGLLNNRSYFQKASSAFSQISQETP